MAMPRTAWLLCVLLAALLLVCPGSGGRVRAGAQQAEAEALLDFVMHVEDSQQPDDDDFSLEQQDVMQDAMDVALLEQSAQEEISPAALAFGLTPDQIAQFDSAQTASSGASGVSSLAEVASSATSRARSIEAASRPTKNSPIFKAKPSPKDGTLRFKKTMPSRLRFKRMVEEASQKLKQERKQAPAPRKQQPANQHPKVHRSLVHISSKASAAAGHKAGSKAGARAGSRSQARSRGRAQARSRSKASTRSKSRSRAHAGAKAGMTPDGQEGDWTEAPSWWRDPGEENVKPWMEDNYGYVVRHHADPHSFIKPDPYPNLWAGRLGSSPAQHNYALHRVLSTPHIAGAPASVHGGQFPGAPPLPELDATMQPTNNLPNAPFYEFDYHKDYVWG